MNPKKLALFIIIVLLAVVFCSKAPVIPQASNRVVLGEYFTHDM
jgi:hypothetical protein